MGRQHTCRHRPSVEKVAGSLKRLAAFKVERCIKPKDFGQPIASQLHNFSDASQDGFGTVTYLRIENCKRVHVSFLLDKARVTPLKPITIPRLELAAAVLAVEQPEQRWIGC